MVTRQGSMFIYANARAGAAKDEEHDGQIYITFTDPDNEEIHLFPMPISKIEQYANLLKQTASGQKIEIVGADRGPRGA